MRPVPALLAALALVACVDADPLALVPETELPVAFSSANASSSSTIDLSVTALVQCANGGLGDFVELSGSLHAMTHASTSASGHTTLVAVFNPQAVTGTGLLGGETYNGNGVTRFHQTFMAGAPKTSSFVNNFLLIGRAGAPSLRVHIATNVSIDGQGAVHVSGGQPHITCG